MTAIAKPRIVISTVWLLVSMGVGRAWALEPDELALVINRNVPASRTLAQGYAEQRHLPAGRIIELSLPAPSLGNPHEEISPEAYDAQVVPVVRDFLTKNHLEKKVKCLVTFWGVPLRIGARHATEADKAERAGIEAQLNQEIRPQVEKTVGELEQRARSLDPNFHPIAGTTPQQLANRAANAMNAAVQKIGGLTDVARQQQAFEQLLFGSEILLGKRVMTLRLAQSGGTSLTAHPPTTQQVAESRDTLAAAQKQVAALNGLPQSLETRAKIREIVHSELGLLAYVELLQFQTALLDANQTEAALDSELALLWWPQYPKARWQLNPLYWRYAGRVWANGPVLMVTRLDGPSQPIVHELIANSIKTEQTGLVGQAALDGRGRTGNDPYASYDQSIRHLAEFLKQHSTIQVTFDDREPVFSPRSVKGIAIYCGWYSLRNYVPPGSFNTGAVGFHVASFEMISLRAPGEKGWVKGLLNDGVAATLGPVAEPYLQSFPPADEFFPLLLTGKPTLAEVYWRTTPWVSWMQTCIGDPLYRPYLHNPHVKISDLPAGLQAAAGEPSTQPAGSPK